MTDPKRFLWTCESDFERSLLRAGRAGAPEGARERALMAASAALAACGASGVAAAGGVAASQAAAGLKIGSLAAIKWIGVLSLAGVGMATGAAIVHHAHQTAASPKAAVNPVSSSSVLRRAVPVPAEPPAPSVSATAAGPEPAPAAPPHVATPSLPSVARSAPKASDSNGSTLPAELAMLERARAAMGAGELPRALSILDNYIDRFPHGAMAPEAAVLRIEALLKAGDRAAANRFASAFLAIDRHSPYAARIQSLLAASSP